MFAADPDAAGGLLADRQPDPIRRMQNRLEQLSPAWSADEDRAYQAEAAGRLGITTEELV